MTRFHRILVSTLACALLGACSGMLDTSGPGHQKPEQSYPDPDQENWEKSGSILDSRLTLFDSNKPDHQFGANGGAIGIGVNGYLWRATLDTLAFMPIASADPFGGTILTDWYAPSGSQNERFKVNAFILSPTLRADGIRISVFRQAMNASGAWVDATSNEDTAAELERTILTKARQLRIAAMGAEE